MFSLNMWVKSLGRPCLVFHQEVVRVEAKPPLAKGGPHASLLLPLPARRLFWRMWATDRGGFVLLHSFVILQARPLRHWHCRPAPTALQPPLRSLRTEPRRRGPKRGSKRCFKITFINSNAAVLLPLHSQWDTGLMIWFPTTHTHTCSLASY